MKLQVPLPRYIILVGVFLLLLCSSQLFLLPSTFPDMAVKKIDTPEAFWDEVNLHMMVFPFDAYVMKDDTNVMEHRTCKETIMVRRLHDWKFQPFTEYHGNSDLPFEGNKNLVCISVGSTVGAMILSLEDDLSFLGSGAATELVVQKLEHALNKSRIDLEVEIVKRTTVAVAGWYKPTSPEAVEERRKDSNTGNFMWEYGATRMINPYTTEFISATSEKAEEESSALVLASANAFNLNKENKNDYSFMENHVRGLTDVVRKIDKPTILLGIGIQAEFKEIEDINSLKLHEHQATLLNEIDRRNQATTSVSVRGDITQTAAMNAGVTNTVSLGCPSLTISRVSDLGAVLEKGWKAVESSVVNHSSLKIGIALPAIHNSPTTYNRVVGNLLSMCESHDCYFLLQMNYDKGLLLRFAGDQVDESKILIFKDGVEDWFDFMQGLDFLVSTRIHGGMAGVAVGVPTLVLPTDFRIMELVNAMKLPHIPFENFSSNNYTSLDQIMKAATKDFVQFEANRRNRLNEYRLLLNSVGIEMDPALVHILQ